MRERDAPESVPPTFVPSNFDHIGTVRLDRPGIFTTDRAGLCHADDQNCTRG
jgi:hypothetical protein